MDCRDVAKPLAGGLAGVGFGEALPHLLLGPHIQVKAQLVGDRGLDVAILQAEEPAPAGRAIHGHAPSFGAASAAKTALAKRVKFVCSARSWARPDAVSA